MNLKNALMKLAIVFFMPVLFASCATYQGKVGDAREALSQRDYQRALEKLKPLADAEGDDQLVYLLDYATALQMSGDFSESSKYFLKADKLAELQDYHSVSRVAGSLLFNEEMVQYKGDTFEKIFINAYLAMNFLQQGNLDSALVESRRINEKFVKLRGEKKESFELNPFSKYLSALVWEASQKWDDAYIAYHDAYKLDPTIPTLPADLIRSSKLARRPDEYDRWRKEFPHVQESPDWYDRKKSTLVILFHQGWGPRKNFSPHSHRIPTLVPVYSNTQSAQVFVNGSKLGSTNLVYNTEQAAIKTLQADAAALVARRVGGVVAKEVVADQIRQKDELLGLVAGLAMHVSDRADLRQWSTLPASIQIYREKLVPGDYEVELVGKSGQGETGERSGPIKVSLKPGSTRFITWRSVN